ncbi:MAG: divergent polysaccharide deacetylase family protein [Nitrospinae bacterium]|nr:divergent polysaccharide deacetylase family protein [Nitrospinota bacterium]
MHFKIRSFRTAFFLIVLSLFCSSTGLADDISYLHALSRPLNPNRPASSAAAPRVAIIIDDLGMNLALAQSFLDLPVPVSFSILPGLAHSREIAELAHLKNRDVLCHIPMEPYKYPKVNAGDYSLLSSMDTQSLEKALKADLAFVPYIVGANNHMGSKLTENERIMRLVLGHLKNLDLFFIDSVTSPNSKAFQLAREMGLRTARRNVFLDSTLDPDFIEAQFRKLKNSALSLGSSIGIGHPNPATISVLRDMIPEFEASGIRFVPVSELAR